jgi:hypothetical protein
MSMTQYVPQSGPSSCLQLRLVHVRCVGLLFCMELLAHWQQLFMALWFASTGRFLLEDRQCRRRIQRPVQKHHLVGFVCQRFQRRAVLLTHIQREVISNFYICVQLTGHSARTWSSLGIPTW